MIYQEIVTEIENLSLDEQLSLMETLARFISRRVFKRNAPETSLEQVRGMLKPAPGEPIPTDADLSDDYTDYLMEKYA
jgi:dihydroneopterin aldolase